MTTKVLTINDITSNKEEKDEGRNIHLKKV